MTDPIIIRLDGEPHGKGRPRAFARGGRVRMYTDGKTVAYEDRLRVAARQVMWNRPPIEGPVQMTVEAHFAVPKSWPKYRRTAALAGQEPHLTKPDADNVLKIAADGISGIVFVDDTQVVDVTIRKHYGAEPGLMVAVNALRVPGPAEMRA